MHLSRFTPYMATSLLTIAGMLAVSCSDDDKPVAPTSHWAWRPLGTDTGGMIHSLAVYDGKLIAGGTIDTAGGVSANDIAAWDGSAWASLGAGMNGPVAALAVGGNKMIGGGDLCTAGG